MTPQSDQASLKFELRRKRFSNFTETIMAVLLAFCIIAFLQWLLEKPASLIVSSKIVSPQHPTLNTTNTAVTNPDNSNARQSAALDNLELLFKSRWPGKHHEFINKQLMSEANNAVQTADNTQLGDSLFLLGVNAFLSNDYDSTDVYLAEALTVFEELGSEIDIARVEMMRGELNMKRREAARRAGKSYDLVQVARWKVANNQFHSAVTDLQQAATENLELKRFGAAAAAYETLYKGYYDNGQLLDAQKTGIEIVKLRASSGQPNHAHSMLDKLVSNGLDFQQQQALKREIQTLQVEYENSVQQINRARDYQQLYNHFIHAGDPVRAWQFRLKSQQSLQGVTQRAMHRRQAGVLALLYTSNTHMDDAENSLQRAAMLFEKYEQTDMADMSYQLQQQVH